MTYGFHHVHIKTHDPKGVADWFGTAFGFEIVIDAERASGDRIIRCALGANQPPFIVITSPVPGQDLPEGRTHQSLGLEHFALTTDDVPAAADRLVELGAVLVDGPITAPDGTVMAFLTVPGDVRIELVHFPTGV
jgi:catechol 2,3-dioxygenase-like lactoylglutathione lyase family enzyme